LFALKASSTELKLLGEILLVQEVVGDYYGLKVSNAYVAKLLIE